MNYACDYSKSTVDRPIPNHYMNKLRMRCEINKLENIFCVV